MNYKMFNHQCPSCDSLLKIDIGAMWGDIKNIPEEERWFIFDYICVGENCKYHLSYETLKGGYEIDTNAVQERFEIGDYVFYNQNYKFCLIQSKDRNKGLRHKSLEVNFIIDPRTPLKKIQTILNFA